ncbi:zinc ribbon domain-containing protein [Williamsia deligens]
MTRVPDAVDCDTCGADARRVVTAVGVRADTTATALIDATRATAERPAVVGGVPGRSSAPRRVSTDPRHRRLPRP